MFEHAKHPPSSASRRVICPGSRALEEKYPDSESPLSKEGEAAHWIAGTVLVCGKFPKTYDNIKAPNGEWITEEMIDGANLYFSSVQEIWEKLKSPIHIEETVDISNIHPDCWGTPDAWIFGQNELHIWDYKFGHGFVEVFENWQLIEYAAGILKDHPADKITFYIVQPRSYHKDGAIRSWTVDFKILERYFKKLIEAEKLSSLESTYCVPSPECTHCKGRYACETLRNVSLTTIDISKLNTPIELDSQQTGTELALLKRAAMLLDARITGLEEQAKSMIKRGKRVNGFKMDSVSSREVWTKNSEEIIALGDILGYDLQKSPVSVTPAQARKLGVPEQILKGYVIRQQGSLKLIAEDIRSSHKIFGAFEHG